MINDNNQIKQDPEKYVLPTMTSLNRQAKQNLTHMSSSVSSDLCVVQISDLLSTIMIYSHVNFKDMDILFTKDIPSFDDIKHKIVARNLFIFGDFCSEIRDNILKHCRTVKYVLKNTDKIINDLEYKESTDLWYVYWNDVLNNNSELISLHNYFLLYPSYEDRAYFRGLAESGIYEWSKENISSYFSYLSFADRENIITLGKKAMLSDNDLLDSYGSSSFYKNIVIDKISYKVIFCIVQLIQREATFFLSTTVNGDYYITVKPMYASGRMMYIMDVIKSQKNFHETTARDVCEHFCNQTFGNNYICRGYGNMATLLSFIDDEQTQTNNSSVDTEVTTSQEPRDNKISCPEEEDK